MRRLLSWLRRHPWRTLLVSLLGAFLLLNVLAYRHARAMTRFAPSGTQTASIGSLSTLQKVGILLNGVDFPHPRSPVRPEDRGLAATVHNFPGHYGRPEAWYLQRADARGIVLMFHGYGECKAQLLPEAEVFLALGYSCFLVDFPGYGGSEGDETSLGYHESIDVDRAVQYVREQWPGQPVLLFGRSMGSVAVLRALAVEGTEADAVLLECPFDRMLSTVQARFSRMGLPTFPAANLLVFWGGVQLGIDGFAHNPVDYAAAVKCPVLLMNGDRDPYVSVEQTAAIFRNLPEPKKRYTFEGLEHEPYLRKQPAEWKACVAQFLRHGEH
jgi:alpha-beta hydrolase superfamily lysophospholipase